MDIFYIKMLVVLRAVILVIAFSISTAFAGEEVNFNAAVKQAQDLLLKGQRLKAVESLLVILKEEKAAKKRLQLIKEIDKLATFFITEKGQRQFELGESMSESNSQLAMEKFNLSLLEEDHNLQIMSSLGRLHLKQNQCKEAKDWAEQILQIYPSMVKGRILKLQVEDCLGNFEAISASIEKIDKEDPINEEMIFRLFVARLLIKKGELKKGLRQLRQMSEEDKPIPEVWYWRWKLDPEKGQLQSSFFEEYLKICKTMSPRLKRMYMKLGAVCIYTNEVASTNQEAGETANEESDN